MMAPKQTSVVVSKKVGILSSVAWTFMIFPPGVCSGWMDYPIFISDRSYDLLLIQRAVKKKVPQCGSQEIGRKNQTILPTCKC